MSRTSFVFGLGQVPLSHGYTMIIEYKLLLIRGPMFPATNGPDPGAQTQKWILNILVCSGWRALIPNREFSLHVTILC